MKKINKVLILILIVLGLAGIGRLVSNEDRQIIEEPTISQNDVTEKTEEEPETDVPEAEIPAESSFEVHYIDVGQADASLVMCDGKYMLIDGGKPEDSSLIYSYLKERGVTEIDYMICIHAHEEHVGGLAGALNYAEVKNVLCSTTNYDTKAFQSFVKYVHQQNKEIEIPSPGMNFTLGSADCTILAVNTVENEPNNSSIVLRIDYGKTAFLFSGDAEQVVETEIMNAGYDVSCTVMKVPHHGSDTSLSARWLYEAMPRYAVISVGADNQYGHPTENTLSKLRDAEVIVYRTDMQGHIICMSDGNDVKFSVEKNPNVNTLENAGFGTENEWDTSISRDLTGHENNESVHYILNVSTKKIHYPSCSSVETMNEKNKQDTNLSKEELMAQGYTPCGRCKP